MFRYFFNIPPHIHALILVLLVVLWLPSFNRSYLLPEESLLISGIQYVENTQGKMYNDVWIAELPLSYGLYRLFYWGFGKITPFLIRIFCIVYIYLLTIYFSGFILELRAIENYKYLPSFLFPFFLSTPWYNLQLHEPLLLLSTLIPSFLSLAQPQQIRPNISKILFLTGCWMGLGLMISYRMLPFLAGFLIVYAIIHSPCLSDIFSLSAGIVSILLGFVAVLFIRGTLNEFFQQAVLFHWDRLLSRESLPNNPQIGYLPAWTLHGLGFSLLAFAGWARFRLRFYTYLVKIRIIEQILFGWLICGLVYLLIRLHQFNLSEIALIAPPLTFYAVKALDSGIIYRIRHVFFVLILVPNLFSYSQYWFPQQFTNSSLASNTWMKTLITRFPVQAEPPKETLLASINSLPDVQNMWVLAPWPDLYLRSGIPLANKYLDYSMTVQRLPSLSSYRHYRILSQSESNFVTYQHLNKSRAQLIVDPYNNFPDLKMNFPTLFNDYTKAGENLYILTHLTVSSTSTVEKR